MNDGSNDVNKDVVSIEAKFHDESKVIQRCFDDNDAGNDGI